MLYLISMVSFKESLRKVNTPEGPIKKPLSKEEKERREIQVASGEISIGNAKLSHLKVKSILTAVNDVIANGNGVIVESGEIKDSYYVDNESTQRPSYIRKVGSASQELTWVDGERKRSIRVECDHTGSVYLEFDGHHSETNYASEDQSVRRNRKGIENAILRNMQRK